jgi:2,5-diamino-6-(ribosylamino)-4(3H)-pyrimidinone 5'-phosphate reductase
MADSWAVGADTHGQILWTGADIDGDEAIALVTQKASCRYLEVLRRQEVSYIVAGKEEIDFSDFSKAFNVLAEHLGVNKLIVEGGGLINGAIFDVVST